MVPKSTIFQLAKALDGIPVLGCLDGTPAAKAGVRYGDILLSVNGMRTRSFGDYVEAKALRLDGMTVVIFRSGVETPVELEYKSDRASINPATLLAELAGKRLLATESEGQGSLS